ncbi:MAG: hypothetical protein Q9M39_02530 [Sulfurovum sp.]|nr:hypothetical protein [Sulfurovum sp.]
MNENIEHGIDEEEVVLESKKKESKQQEAIRLVKQAKSIVKEADQMSLECKLLLDDDLVAYKDTKLNLKEKGFDTCEALLEYMGYRSTDDEAEEVTVVFEGNTTEEFISIKEVFSGKFTAVLSALIVGGVTAAGMVYLATEKLGITLSIDKIPSPEIRESILSWFSTLVGVEANMLVGASIFGVSVLTAMVIVYMLRVILKTNSNLHTAIKQFDEAGVYAENKTDCKEEMDKVDAHMKEVIKTFRTYEILFNEQQGKLQRIVHIEGQKEQATDYHDKSYAEIRETKKLLSSIKDFMAISISKDGKLSEESVLRLEKLKTQMDNMIEKLY